MMERKKRKQEQIGPDRIKELIIRIGDQSFNQINSHLNKLQQEIEANINEQEQIITQTLLSAITYLPGKQCIYARVFSGGQNQIQQLLKKLFPLVIEKLEFHLNEGNIREARQIILWFGQLIKINILDPQSLFQFYLRLIKQAEANLDQTQDFFLYLVASTICFIGNEIQSETIIREVERLLVFRGKPT